MWSRQQITTHCRYATAAGLTDEERYAILFQVTGKRSSRDRKLTNQHYDQVMAALEGALHEAILNGRSQPEWVKDLNYWRDRCPAANAASSRHIATIRRLYADLHALRPLEYSDPIKTPAAAETFLLTIAAQATGAWRIAATTIDTLSATTAGHLVSALRDRLAHAQRSGHLPAAAHS